MHTPYLSPTPHTLIGLAQYNCIVPSALVSRLRNKEGGGGLELVTHPPKNDFLAQNLASEKSNLNKRPLARPTQTPSPKLPAPNPAHPIRPQCPQFPEWCNAPTVTYGRARRPITPENDHSSAASCEFACLKLAQHGHVQPQCATPMCNPTFSMFQTLRNYAVATFSNITPLFIFSGWWCVCFLGPKKRIFHVGWQVHFLLLGQGEPRCFTNQGRLRALPQG